MYTTSYDGIFNHSIEYLEPLFNFLDNVCTPETCAYAHPYPKSPQYFSSRVDCKKGDCFTCKHPEHPIIKAINNTLLIINALQDPNFIDGEHEMECPDCCGTLKVFKKGSFFTYNCLNCNAYMIT